MLFIPIPNGERTGNCRINGGPCEFKIDGGVFAFRPQDGSKPWDRRRILHAEQSERLTNYVCAGADNTGIVITPVIAPDGRVGIQTTPAED